MDDRGSIHINISMFNFFLFTNLILLQRFVKGILPNELHFSHFLFFFRLSVVSYDQTLHGSQGCLSRFAVVQNLQSFNTRNVTACKMEKRSNSCYSNIPKAEKSIGNIQRWGIVLPDLNLSDKKQTEFTDVFTLKPPQFLPPPQKKLYK